MIVSGKNDTSGIVFECYHYEKYFDSCHIIARVILTIVPMEFVHFSYLTVSTVQIHPILNVLTIKKFTAVKL